MSTAVVSMHARWMGGAGTSAPAASQGSRSMLVFWMGGAGTFGTPAPSTESPKRGPLLNTVGRLMN